MRDKWKNSFSEWYNDIIERGQILDIRYPVKGNYVWFPYGFKLRKHVLEVIRGVQRVSSNYVTNKKGGGTVNG